jgi:hypothetical protein
MRENTEVLASWMRKEQEAGKLNAPHVARKVLVVCGWERLRAKDFVESYVRLEGSAARTGSPSREKK